jgi:L-threonylcarbamoyladenylate synthase
MEKKVLIKGVLEGKIFIYPTDTIYGLGCNALDEDAVKRLKGIKKRDIEKPLSIIVPSIDWIKKNLIVDFDIKKYLPGPYTLILKKKNLDFLNHVSSNDRLGVRIPKNSFTKVIQKSNVPFITTSVNISGEPPIRSVRNMPKEILDNVDFIIDEGELNGDPSTLVMDGVEIKR